jgi:BirA family biotin operon repressor/biotin-[acetyl-CoA-carboxylase] ligase
MTEITASITVIDSATSSSNLVWAAAAQGAPAGTAYLVREQTAGRGRRGAGWSSARGGMYFSILLRPKIAARHWFGLSFVAALAIRQELAACLVDVPVQVKWPNDILAGGGKLCGILLEARDGAVVIGTGVNIAPVDNLPGAKHPATSLLSLGGDDITPDALADRYAGNLLVRAAAYETGGFDPVRMEWLVHCAHIGSMMRVLQSDVHVEGSFAGLGDDGALHLRHSNGERHVVTTGDVELMG